MKIKRDFIDWNATGNKLFRLRSDNYNLRKYVCSALNHDTYNCNGNNDCENCSDKYIDRNISRKELAEVIGISESVIFNWENGRTPIDLENILFYCKMAQVGIEDIIVYK